MHYVAFDISTSVVGMTVLDNDGSWIFSDYIELHNIRDDIAPLHAKMRAAQPWIKEQVKLIGNDDVKHVFEQRLGGFSNGKTSSNTLMTLAGFNALFSYEVARIHSEAGANVRIAFLHPSTVKAIMKKDGLDIPNKGIVPGLKKKMTLQFVEKKLPLWHTSCTRTGNPKPFMFDMADSYITARACWLLDNNF